MAALNRRDVLRLGLGGALGALGLGGLPQLAWAKGDLPAARSLIVLWLDGGSSQLETFDPHAGTTIGGPTKAIATKQKGVQFAAGLPRLAERADRLAVIRSVVTKEGEHQRGRYLMRTGFPMVATVKHPAVTAVVGHEAERPKLEIPAHVSFLSQNPPRGGYLGVRHDAFKVGDPKRPVPDLLSPVGRQRYGQRLEGLQVLERGFRKGRGAAPKNTEHDALVKRATSMMDSKQVEAFDVARESSATRGRYGKTAFGRACLAARRLVETGVPAIEVTLGGWDTHVDHFEASKAQTDTLDRGFSALLDDLAERKLLDSTLILCATEFGRTPTINPLEGRDHWTRGFSIALAGGGLRVGQTLGSTDPEGSKAPEGIVRPQDVYATLYERLGVDTSQVFDTPGGRPIKVCEGMQIKALLKT